MQMFSSAPSRDIFPSSFSLRVSSVSRYLLQAFFVASYGTEICLQLRYVWTETRSLRSDVQYVTPRVTERLRIFIHSCNFWLTAGAPSRSNLKYANNFWRPSYTQSFLSPLHCHMKHTCNCDLKTSDTCLLSLCLSFSGWIYQFSSRCNKTRFAIMQWIFCL